MENRAFDIWDVISLDPYIQEPLAHKTEDSLVIIALAGKIQAQ